MELATFKLVGMSPMQQNKFVQDEKKDKESADDYERRTWRSRMHFDSTGEVYIPPMALKNCLSECAKFLSVKIKGNGKATFTKHFEAGLLVLDPITLGIKAKDVEGQWLHVPSNGVRGNGSRVMKCFPKIPVGWTGIAQVHILDPVITHDVFEYHLKNAGQFIGLGGFRPRNNGFYGRFKFEDMQYTPGVETETPEMEQAAD